MQQVLLVEDNETIAHILFNLLPMRGFEVTHVVSTSEALECLENNTYDILLLDINLIGGSGIDVLKTVRTDLQLDVPVIMLTAYQQESIVIQSLEAGANDLMTKPISPSELVIRMRKCLKS
jgi:DNA-binding response OmpR family regulator